MSLKPKVVLLSMFEPASGVKGEFRLFLEREQMRALDLWQSGLKQLYTSADGKLLGLVAGVGTANTAISVMALGLCEQIDVRESFWLVAGIAGGNPRACSLGSPVWADWAVDGDLAFEIDARDLPEDWPCGIIPLGAKEPFGVSSMPPELFGYPYQVFRLNASLVSRACRLSADLALADDPALRALKTDLAPALKAPAVGVGSVLSGARFWHGPRHNAWAEQWVSHWTRGQGRFVTSAMEDTGTLHAIAQLGRMGRADPSRVMILRTVSNYTMPLDGGCVVASISSDAHGGEFPAHEIALENSYRVASAVYRDLIENFGAWENALV